MGRAEEIVQGTVPRALDAIHVASLMIFNLLPAPAFHSLPAMAGSETPPLTSA